MTFSFSFAGDDIDENGNSDAPAGNISNNTGSILPPLQQSDSSTSAFPVQGKPLLPPTHHDLSHMLSRLPSKIAYSTLTVDLEGGRGTIEIPRRELWDVRVQLMAEEENNESASESQPGLGDHDVKTGIYEGGFKSWESSVDLVKVLASENAPEGLLRDPCALMEVCASCQQAALLFFSFLNMSHLPRKEEADIILGISGLVLIYVFSLCLTARLWYRLTLTRSVSVGNGREKEYCSRGKSAPFGLYTGRLQPICALSRDSSELHSCLGSGESSGTSYP